MSPLIVRTNDAGASGIADQIERGADRCNQSDIVGAGDLARQDTDDFALSIQHRSAAAAMICLKVELNEVLSHPAYDAAREGRRDFVVVRLIKQFETKRVANHRDFFSLADLVEVRLNGMDKAELRRADAQDGDIRIAILVVDPVDLGGDGAIPGLTGSNDLELRNASGPIVRWRIVFPVAD